MIVYLFIHDLFMNIMSLLNNTHFIKYHNLFWKNIYFGHYLINNTKSTLSKLISIREVLCSDSDFAKVKLQAFNNTNLIISINWRISQYVWVRLLSIAYIEIAILYIQKRQKVCWTNYWNPFFLNSKGTINVFYVIFLYLFSTTLAVG